MVVRTGTTLTPHATERPAEMRRYAVAQMGARMHYGVPSLLERSGMLERFYTDIYAGPLTRTVARRSPFGFLKRWAGRYSSGLPAGRVSSFPLFGLQYARKLRSARNESERAEAFLWSGREFGRRVCSRGLGSANAVYAFNDAALEILQMARRQGLYTVVEQTIAPLAVEAALMTVEHAKFSDWEPAPLTGSLLEERACRQREEWQTADAVLCGSGFVRDGIEKDGGPVDRCRVVPYGVTPARKARQRTAHAPLRVLTVGAVGLRKGSPYVWKAAMELAGRAEFRMVGPVHVSDAACRRLRESVAVIGAVPRSEVAAHYDWADVFLLPSICEGSATVTYEALLAGLPVLCTPNTGSMVKDGRNGFVVPAGDPEAVVDRLIRLSAPGALADLSHGALATAAELTLDAYQKRALEVLSPETVAA